MSSRLKYAARVSATFILLVGAVRYGSAFRPAPGNSPIGVRLSEWKVALSQATTVAGRVTFTIVNAGSIPHAFEVEGQGIERETALIQPGATETLTLTLKPGRYEVYCPVGKDSHKKLGMDTRFDVQSAKGSPLRADDRVPRGDKANAIQVKGGGSVIQILPGPFPFPDSAAPILKEFGEEKEGLESQAQNGPYSNNVAQISGDFTITAWDKGSVRDSVKGLAEFTSQDGSRWQLQLDRVQTKDVPHHPRFGGVIMGLYYHGSTGVHTPLVPTINSAVALWAVGHLRKDGAVVTDNAMVHVMLLSHTRRASDFALACWDCSQKKIDELQLQILPGPGEPKFDAPGGFLFINWERSAARGLVQAY
jgi:hypothetical protein